MALSYKQAVQEIINVGNRLDDLHLAPATAGNYSIRLNNEMAITVSGAHKGHLTSDDVMRTDLKGNPIDKKKCSAETLLHCGIYKTFPETNAILHTHSVPCTVLSRMIKEDHLILEGYELLKVFPGITTHETSIRLPIFDNTQDMTILQAQVDAAFKQYQQTPAYLIRGHGLYVWAGDMTKTLHVVEGLEFLLSCELETRKLMKG